MKASAARTAREVLEDHLWQSREGTLEDDLVRNFAGDVVILTGFGAFRGYAGMRYLTELLQEQLPIATFDYRTVAVEGELGFLEWTASSDRGEVKDGADSYLIRGGHIVAQTIHYTVSPRSTPSELGRGALPTWEEGNR